jgi:hypothetical protein
MLMLLLGMSLFTGCGGCTPDDSLRPDEKELDPEEKEKKKKAEKPPDYTFEEIRAQPNEFAKDRAKVNYVKRGHWVTTTQQVLANNFDVQADVQAVVTNLAGGVYDIEHTRYALSYTRPVALPKGQPKPLETLFFIPREPVLSQSVNLRNDLLNVRGGLAPLPQSTSVLPLEEWQYLFVVLSSRPTAYGFLEQTQTFTPLRPFASESGSARHYQLIRPVLDRGVPLPSHALTWSSLAVILWDDIDPTLFTAEQSAALIDWLHWGGTLLINGPQSLSRLKGSFLDPYLPADVSSEANLASADFAELNEYWSLRTSRRPSEARDLKPVKPLAGLRLTCRADAQFLPHTGDLVAEGRVGRGRVVLTAFPLQSRIVQDWKNFDGFLNGALLRRPARKFLAPDGDPYCDWDALQWREFQQDARLISNLRYFARDCCDNADPLIQMSYRLTPTRMPPTNQNALNGFTGDEWGLGQKVSSALQTGPADDPRFAGWLAVPLAGVASWNNFSGVANAARKHIDAVSGIEIPDAQFVVQVLAAYLFVLVPVNWAFFRLLQRVEWAWIAAPLIALGGAAMVTHLARIDIGFVRSRTEIDVIELYGGHRRGHVSRFINLYTALSTPYDLEFEDPDALAQPMPKGNDRFAPFSATSRVALHRESSLSLSGFKVESNSQGLVRVEQQLDLGGSLTLTEPAANEWQLENGTELDLRDVIVVRRTAAGYVASGPHALQPQGKVNLSFSAPKAILNREELVGQVPVWQSSPTAAPEAKPELRLSQLFDLAMETLKLQVDEVRLVAWSSGAVPGISYKPDSAQVNSLSFVLAHLRLPLPGPLEHDKNVLADVVQQSQAAVVTPEDIEANQNSLPIVPELDVPQP